MPVWVSGPQTVQSLGRGPSDRPSAIDRTASLGNQLSEALNLYSEGTKFVRAVAVFDKAGRAVYGKRTVDAAVPPTSATSSGKMAIA